MSKIKKVHLLVIDPQHDFCDPGGALFVPGAVEDMERLGAMINRIGDRLEDIHVTLDSHHPMDCAHPGWWKNSKGEHPAPFTIITASDVRDGIWMPTIPSMTKPMLEYVGKLEKSGRYPLCIWPPHCLIGSWGQTVVDPIYGELNRWAMHNRATVDFVTKGSNPRTEHYSGVKAEVPDPRDPSTQLNVGLIQTLETADVILLAGEAGSHCLANTVRDIADGFSDPEFIKRFVLLTDATSPVPNFEKLQESFIEEMKSRGMQTTTTTKFLS